MRAFWQRVVSEIEGGGIVYVCLVAANKKGSPGTPVARMLLCESGDQLGTIGGGIMEKKVVAQAGELLQQSAKFGPRLQTLHHQSVEKGAASGLFCGGAQTNLEMLLDGDDLPVLRAVCDSLDRAPTRILEISAKGLSVREVDELPDFSSELFESESADWRYSLNLVNLRRIAIFGAGHCGVALAETMLRLGYFVSLVDPRGASVFTWEAIPQGIECYEDPFLEAVQHISFPEQTNVVVMTHSFPTDVEALNGILGRQFKSVGVMGSAPKITRIRRSLKDLGFNDLQIAKVRAPVGLSFNSDTPEEIAVSVAAQILLERENRG